MHPQILVTYLQITGILRSVTYRIPRVVNRMLEANGMVSEGVGTWVRTRML
jgi:hypothetical protein